jgi:hypothetical protein
MRILRPQVQFPRNRVRRQRSPTSHQEADYPARLRGAPWQRLSFVKHPRLREVDPFPLWLSTWAARALYDIAIFAHPAAASFPRKSTLCSPLRGMREKRAAHWRDELKPCAGIELREIVK